MVSNEWLAGFFDGEGSIGIYARNWDRDKKYKYFVLVVSLAQSGPHGKRVLDFCKELYGGSVYSQKTTKTQTENKIMWKWNISADLALKFLHDIYPHTKIKTEQIVLGFEFQKLTTKRNDNQKAALLAEKIKDLKK